MPGTQPQWNPGNTSGIDRIQWITLEYDNRAGNKPSTLAEFKQRPIYGLANLQQLLSCAANNGPCLTTKRLTSFFFRVMTTGYRWTLLAAAPAGRPARGGVGSADEGRSGFPAAAVCRISTIPPAEALAPSVARGGALSSPESGFRPARASAGMHRAPHHLD